MSKKEGADILANKSSPNCARWRCGTGLEPATFSVQEKWWSPYSVYSRYRGYKLILWARYWGVQPLGLDKPHYFYWLCTILHYGEIPNYEKIYTNIIF